MEEITISVEMIKALRDQSGAGVMSCRSALLQAKGDMQKALDFLKEQSLIIVEKRANRSTAQGLVESYIHGGGKIGAMVEVNCETDFVARTDEFKAMAHNLAMQVAAMAPKYLSKEDLPAGVDEKPQEACLLEQPFIRNPDMTIRDVVNEVIAKTGENVKVKRFARFELGG